jgi:hypothetical protein
MQKRTIALLAVALLMATTGFAKDKKKSVLPAYVLTARTVAVIIDPAAGVSVDDPLANRVAQKDVETAILNWGRFQTLMSGQEPDLIIVVRKGSGRVARPTISDPRQNDNAGSITPFDNGAAIGVQHGRPVDPQSGRPADPQSSGPADQTPHPQAQIGSSDDSFAVYQGNVDKPLDAPPAWRYVASDALQPHSVPAVEKFRKAIADAEKAASKGP